MAGWEEHAACDSECVESSPAIGHALFKRREFWLHDRPYFMPDTCQERDLGDYTMQCTTTMTGKSLKLTFCSKLTLEIGEQGASPLPEG